MRKLTSSSALILLLVAIFIAINVSHFRYLPVHVVLYDAVLDAIIATVFVALLYFWRLRAMLDLTIHESLLSCVIGLLLCLLYAVLVPTVIDRSLSIYILEKLDQRGGRIAQSAFDHILKEEFFPE